MNDIEVCDASLNDLLSIIGDIGHPALTLLGVIGVVTLVTVGCCWFVLFLPDKKTINNSIESIFAGVLKNQWSGEF